MRIKKVSQVAGLVGSVVNSQSESNKDTYSCDYINGLNTFSTTEQIVGKWIDNKPIYRKVLTGTANTTNTTIDTSANVSSMNIIKIDGWIYKSATIQQQIGTYASDGNSSGIYVDNNGLKLLLPSAWVPCTYTAIIEYTKTTD